MHTLMSWLCIITIRLDRKMPMVAKVIIWTLSIAIIVATQTLKQHYVIDLIAGIALAELAFWVLKDTKVVTIFKGWMTKLNKLLKFE
jgi:membrane-associated phospholipid phosphatase